MKKGFTLVELLAVIIILGVIALIAVPTVNIVIKNGRQDALEQTISNIETAAYSYSNRNDIGYSSETKSIQIDTLKKAGLLKDQDIINPVTNAPLEGCVLYRWDDNNKQYQFNYDNDCQINDLEVQISNVNGIFNELGWAKNDFYVAIQTTGTSYNYCVANKKCSPNTKVNSNKGYTNITLESDKVYVCAYAISGKLTSDIVCDTYKLDKTKPIPGTLNITGTMGENEWYVTDVNFTISDGYDDLSGHLSTITDAIEITTNTSLTKYMVTTTDKAGNISTREYAIKVDKTIPTVNIKKSVVNNENVLTSTITPTSTVSGYTYQWYKDGNIISSATSSSYTTKESGVYKLIVTTGSGKVVESNSITINKYNITYNLNGGTGNISNTIKIEDLSTNITSSVPTRTGYTFIGWSLSSTSKDPVYSTNSVYTDNKDITLYAIWKKGYTYTFVNNGATISSNSSTCYVYNAETSCNITTPTISRDGYTIIGYNKDKNATTKQIGSNTSLSINSNETYYAITSKILTLTYNSNSGSGTTSSQTCTMYNTATNCSITLNSSNFTKTGYTFLGYYTSTYKDNPMNYYADTYSDLKQAFNYDSTKLYSHYLTNGKSEGRNISQYTPNGNIALSSDTTLYAGWVKGITVSYASNGGNGTTSSQTCYMFNSNTSCSITLNTNGFTKTGHTFTGWSTNTSSVTHNAGTSYNFSSNTTLNAIWKANNYACSAGYYLSSNATSCTKCEAGSYCSGGTYTFGSSTQGKNTCPSGYGSSATGSSSISSCYLTTTAGKYIATANSSTQTSCQSGYYCPSTTIYYGSTGGRNTCPSGYGSSASGSSSASSCYKTITATFVSNNATLVDTANTDSATSDSCQLYYSSSSCTVYSPNITAPSNTPTVLGFNTSANSTSSSWSVNTAKSISSNVTYYAITMKNAVTNTITYAKGTGVSAIGSTSGSCTIAATYNGTSQATSCTVTLPTITASTGYTVSGWYNGSTKVGNASASVSVSSTQTLTAKTTLNSYACSAGYYLSSNATSCTKCEAGSYCPGGTYSYSSSVQGKNTCPSGYGTSAAGSSSASSCYKTITVTYSANGGSGTTSNSSCNAYYSNTSCSITLNKNNFTRTNYTFQGWSTNTSSVTHNAGQSYSFSSNTTLNAIWKENYYCSTGTLKEDSSKGYICVASNASLTYGSWSSPTTYSSVSTCTENNSSSCSSCTSYTTCSTNSTTYTKTKYTRTETSEYTDWEIASTNSGTSCTGYKSSTSDCTGTACAVCKESGGGTTTTYTKTEYTRTHETTGGKWCGTYNYSTPTDLGYKDTDETSKSCESLSNSSCTFITCNFVQCPSGYSYKNGACRIDGCVNSCPSDACINNCPSKDEINKYSCSQKTVTDCKIYKDSCVRYSTNFTPQHKDGVDYTSCTGSWYDDWKVKSTESGLASCSGNSSTDTCTGTSCTVCKQTSSTSSKTYTITNYTRSETTKYSEWQQDSQDTVSSCTANNSSSCSSCTSYTTCSTNPTTYTKKVYTRSTYYACPSGWSWYSGSGSTQVCYKAAIK